MHGENNVKILRTIASILCNVDKGIVLVFIMSLGWKAAIYEGRWKTCLIS
jgi:hypothetical protein